MKSLLKKESNLLVLGLIIACFVVITHIYVPSADASFLKKREKQKIVQLDTAQYRVYYLTGAPEKKPELGQGEYSELQYKIVYQDDWVSDSSRLIEVDFLDNDDFIQARDVVADKSFNPQGEYYGSQWIKSGQEKNIKRAEVHEVIQKNKTSESAPAVKAPKKAPTPIKQKFDRKNYYLEKNPKLKEIFDRKVLTESDIEEALKLTRPVGSAAASAPDDKKKEKTEGDGADEVSLETSFS